jgi:hypothetical protein
VRFTLYNQLHFGIALFIFKYHGSTCLRWTIFWTSFLWSLDYTTALFIGAVLPSLCFLENSGSPTVVHCFLITRLKDTHSALKKKTLEKLQGTCSCFLHTLIW